MFTLVSSPVLQQGGHESNHPGAHLDLEADDIPEGQLELDIAARTTSNVGKSSTGTKMKKKYPSTSIV